MQGLPDKASVRDDATVAFWVGDQQRGFIARAVDPATIPYPPHSVVLANSIDRVSNELLGWGLCQARLPVFELDTLDKHNCDVHGTLLGYLGSTH
jgi:hypothetical protein